MDSDGYNSSICPGTFFFFTGSRGMNITLYVCAVKLKYSKLKWVIGLS